MQQIWIPKAGGPSVMELREAPDPAPAAGQCRIRVDQAGINFADIMGRMGLYPDLPPMPVVVGYEVAGTVDAVGEGVDKSWVGKDVLAMCQFGGYSSIVCVDAIQVFERPAGMSAEIGAAIPVNYLTAYQLVTVMGALKPGETMLVHSAGGGVGIAATQLAKHIGARVIGTASAGKHAALKEMGVDDCIDYRTQDFEHEVRELTNGRGVELILDAVGGDSFKKGFRLLSATGRLGMFGMSSAATGARRNPLSLIKSAASMPWFSINPVTLMNENKSAFGVNMGRLWHESEMIQGWMNTLLELHQAGVVKPQVHKSFAFADAADAHAFIQDRKNFGKVLLHP